MLIFTLTDTDFRKTMPLVHVKYTIISQNVCCWLFSSPESIYPEGLINSSRFKHLWFTTEQHIPIHSYNSQAKSTRSPKFSILSSQKTDGQTSFFFKENFQMGILLYVYNVARHARGHSVKKYECLTPKFVKLQHKVMHSL